MDSETVDTRSWPNMAVISGHYLRRWPNITETLGERLVF